MSTAGDAGRAPAPPSAPFRRRTLWILGLVVALSLATTIGLFLFGDDLGGPPDAGTDAYSRSDLGTHCLVALLERADGPAVISSAGRWGRPGPTRRRCRRPGCRPA